MCGSCVLNEKTLSNKQIGFQVCPRHRCASTVIYMLVVMLFNSSQSDIILVVVYILLSWLKDPLSVFQSCFEQLEPCWNPPNQVGHPPLQLKQLDPFLGAVRERPGAPQGETRTGTRGDWGVGPGVRGVQTRRCAVHRVFGRWKVMSRPRNVGAFKVTTWSSPLVDVRRPSKLPLRFHRSPPSADVHRWPSRKLAVHQNHPPNHGRLMSLVEEAVHVLWSTASPDPQPIHLLEVPSQATRW